MIKNILLFATILIFIACNQPSQKMTINKKKPIDTHSHSIPSESKTQHLSLDLTADFDNQILKGTAKYTLINDIKAEQIILDSRDLTIHSVTVDSNMVEYTLGKNDAHLGQALHIPIDPESKTITINYETSPTAAALQWLNPQQTADKKHPFLFTQGQAILTRTWIPCQDSPGIRITYDAQITCPKDLLPVMSASNPTEKNATGTYTFEMKQPIPPYLLALAIGDLDYGDIGKQTGVYAEPSVLEKGLYEFSDMQAMLEAAEGLYGPYLWERYDVIILPPSFPFGGMENPRLTFATPTILAGDKSLTALIAHELAHSWSGNLVTNATWNDFWLNEGFTVYFERRIMETLYGEEYANMLAMLGFQDLQHEVHALGESHKDTHLHLDLDGRDPDDGMTDIAYEKGAYFLTLLEEQVGREAFDKFLKDYFETHKFQTLTTDEFEVYLDKHLIKPYSVDINIDEWIYGAGIPDNCPSITSDKFTKVDAIVSKIPNGELPTQAMTKDWTTHEWLHFIRALDDDVDSKALDALNNSFAFADSGNSEIAAAWYEKSIKLGHYDYFRPQLEEFLFTVGRRKFLTPLYSALKEAGDIKSARSIYAKSKPNYHSVSTQTLDALLDVE